MKDSANHCGFAPVNIEPRRQHNQVWAALQRHESRHSGAHTELARFVIARRQHATPIACATHAHWFAAQRRSVAHLDGGIKAIHVEVNDGTSRLLILHMEISHNATTRPSSVSLGAYKFQALQIARPFRY